MSDLVCVAQDTALELAEGVADDFAKEVGDAEQVTKDWLRAFDERTNPIPDHEVVHTFSSVEVCVALYEYLIEDLREDHAIHRARIAGKRRKEASARLESALAEFDGFFLDRNRGARMAPEQFAVIQPDRVAQFKRVIDTSKRIAQSAPTEVNLDEVDQAHMVQFEEYYLDLLRTLDNGGDDQRQAVVRIAECRRVAQSTIRSRGTAPPLKFLAQCVVLTTPTQNGEEPAPTPGNYL